MSAPKSFMSLPDARGFLNRAIESHAGIRAKFATEKQVKTFRFRCYTARSRDREHFLKVNKDATTGWSPWDTVMLTIKASEEVGEEPGFWYLYAVHDEEYALSQIAVEELAGDE